MAPLPSSSMPPVVGMEEDVLAFHGPALCLGRRGTLWSDLDSSLQRKEMPVLVVSIAAL